MPGRDPVTLGSGWMGRDDQTLCRAWSGEGTSFKSLYIYVLLFDRKELF